MQSQSIHPTQETMPPPNRWQRLHHNRLVMIAMMTLVAILSATFVIATVSNRNVAIGQSSQDFDLACRSILASGGNVAVGGNFALISAFGFPFAPPKNSDTAPTYAVRSVDYGLRAGFLPGYPTNQSAATSGTTNSPTVGEQSNAQRLPLILNVRAVIRGGC